MKLLPIFEMAVKKDDETVKGYVVGDSFINHDVKLSVVGMAGKDIICKTSSDYLAKFDAKGEDGNWLHDIPANTKYKEFGTLIPKLEIGDVVPFISEWDGSKFAKIKNLKVLGMEGDKAVCKAANGKFYIIKPNTNFQGNDAYDIDGYMDYDYSNFSDATKKALADAGFKAKVDKPIKKRPIPSELVGKLFVVWAHSGRNNGCALVAANNKVEARAIAKKEWLDLGQIDSVETYASYVKSTGDDIEEDFASYPKVKKVGDWEEMEWGT